MQIDSVEEWTRNARPVGVHALFAAPASTEGIAGISAWARVGRRDDERARRERGAGPGARDGHFAVLERLAQGLERRAAEFQNLVEKENAVVCERDLAWSDGLASAHEAGLADGVVRASERTRGDEASIGGEKTGDAVDHRDGERVFEAERRQHRRQTASKHRLATPRGPDEEHVVAAGSRDLESAAPGELPPNFGEIGQRGRRLPKGCGRGRVEVLVAGEVPADLIEIVGEPRFDAAGHTGLGAVVARDDRARDAASGRADEVSEQAAHGTNRAGERELADQDQALERAWRNFAERGERSDGNREIERGAAFSQVGRSEVHGDAVLGHEDAEMAEGGADANAALANGAVGEPHQFEPSRAACAGDLNAARIRVEANEGGRMSGGEHARGRATIVPAPAPAIRRT